jgi:aspartyl-tRNA synthetase
LLEFLWFFVCFAYQKKDTGEIEVYVEEMRILDPTAPYDGTETESTNGQTDVVLEGNTDDAGSLPVINKYTYRTHNCGELKEAHVGAEVTICGWVEYQRMKKFLVLRDGYGCTQIIIPEEEGTTSTSPPVFDIESIPYESIVKVTGVVMARPPGTVNEKMTTGHIEVYMKTLEVLNEAKPNLPIELREHNRTGEFKRLEHRYIDLR